MGEPMPVGEVLSRVVDTTREFPFQTWAAVNGFFYPAAAQDFLSQCGSAAEAFFARAFVTQRDVVIEGRIARCAGFLLELQVSSHGYAIDAVLRHTRLPGVRLAIEIDGLAFHQRHAAQVAADYLRQRRIVAAGFVVIRYTATETFADPSQCLRQAESILSGRIPSRSKPL